MKYVQAGVVHRTELPLNIRTKPFIMPDAGDDEVHLYVNAVKPEAPIDYCTVGGINFEKLLLPKARCYRENAGKYFSPSVLVRGMTEAQAEAIKKAAAGKIITIPQRPNPDWDRQNFEEEYLPSFQTNLAEWIICQKKEEYDEAERQIDISQSSQRKIAKNTPYKPRGNKK